MKGCFITLQKEWNRIDYLRINKFMYLVRFKTNDRQILTQVFLFLEKNGFDKGLDRKMSHTILDQLFKKEAESKFMTKAQGLALHVIQIFVECLSRLDIQKNLHYLHFLSPWIKVPV